MLYIGPILRQARKNKRMTQEQAAQHLPIDIRTLQRYETNEQRCPMEIIVAMSEAYEDRTLLYRAIQQSEIWPQILPPFQQLPLPQAACAVLDALMALQGYARPLLHIAANSPVQKAGQSQIQDILSMVKALLAASLQLMEASEKGGAA